MAKSKARSNARLRMPVRTRAHDLPFLDDAFNWDSFERFCTDLVRLHPETETHSVHRYGVQGDDQKGIDIVARRTDGTTWAFQCRRVKEFGPTDACGTIEACSHEADRKVICLGRRATSGVRNVVKAFEPVWDVWDAEDLTSEVRGLPIATAARIITRFFGDAWCEAILGLGPIRTFLPAELYFKRLLATEHLFNHAWQFLGRAAAIKELLDFVEAGSGVALVQGPGTIGKSKLLYELCRRNDEREGPAIYFIADGVTVTPDAVSDLDHSECVVVVDDAHRREDLDALLSVILQRHTQTKVILSTRPQGVPEVMATLSRLGMPAPTSHIILERLSREDVDQLAQNALGPDLGSHAARLAAITRDSPLVTLVGGRLLRDRKLDPVLLERDDEFRFTVLNRFRDEMLGRVGDDIEPGIAQKSLETIAAISPLSAAVPGQFQALAVHLGLELPYLERVVQKLEDAGLLLRIGRRYRITPDVLSDHLLAQAVRGRDGRATGMERILLDRFQAVCFPNLLRNFAELDWRCRAVEANQPHDNSLLQHLWAEIVDAFEVADLSGKFTMLNDLEGVGFFQPEMILRLGSSVLAMPDTSTDDTRWTMSPQFIRHQFAPLLRPVGYHLAHLRTAMDLLWSLGRNDKREIGQTASHPMRLLVDLAEYDQDKPLAFNEAAVEAAALWLDDAEISTYRHSPLDVLDALLVRNACATRTRGFQYVFTPFVVNMSVVRRVRDRALALLLDQFRRGNVRLALRAAESVEEALQEPMPIFGQEISEQARAAWEPSQHAILDLVATVAEEAPHPLVRERLIDALSWHAKRSHYPEVRRRADDLLATLRSDGDGLLLRVLRDSWHIDELPDEEEVEDHAAALERHEAKLDDEASTVVEDFVDAHERPLDGARFLAQTFAELTAAREKLHPYRFMKLLCSKHESYAASIGREIIKDRSGLEPISPFWPSFVGVFHSVDPIGFHETLSWSSGAIEQSPLEIELARTVAAAASSHGWLRRSPISESDLALVLRLVALPDVETKTRCIDAISGLAQHSPDGLSHLFSVDFGGSATVARAWCRVFNGRRGLKLEEASDTGYRWLLGQLLEVDEIADYAVRRVLESIARRLPFDVVDFLIGRVRRGRARPGYRALPTTGTGGQIGGFAPDVIPVTLERIVDTMLQEEGLPRHGMKVLFSALSRGHSGGALPLLVNLVQSGAKDRVELAANLASGFRGFALLNVAFVASCLEAAAAHGPDCLRRATFLLQSTELDGPRSGTVGEPFPEDVRLRDESTKVLAGLEVGSRAHDFYKSLRASAVQAIERQLARDAEYLDDHYE